MTWMSRLRQQSETGAQQVCNSALSGKVRGCRGCRPFAGASTGSIEGPSDRCCCVCHLRKSGAQSSPFACNSRAFAFRAMSCFSASPEVDGISEPQTVDARSAHPPDLMAS